MSYSDSRPANTAVSVPVPPSILSSPAPPVIRSSPAPPLIWSSPPNPKMMSSPSLPVILSFAAVPARALLALSPLTFDMFPPRIHHADNAGHFPATRPCATLQALCKRQQGSCSEQELTAMHVEAVKAQHRATGS